VSATLAPSGITWPLASADVAFVLLGFIFPEAGRSCVADGICQDAKRPARIKFESSDDCAFAQIKTALVTTSNILCSLYPRMSFLIRSTIRRRPHLCQQGELCCGDSDLRPPGVDTMCMSFCTLWRRHVGGAGAARCRESRLHIILTRVNANRSLITV
jgi:hypothetical protein